ncbi:hypothetical protein CGCFRS4_v013470 [Colletotrichum fructicola]|nr:hypothetical protein CGCFRS4_v013470 [Colletotrichum fructicola]
MSMYPDIVERCLTPHAHSRTSAEAGQHNDFKSSQTINMKTTFFLAVAAQAALVFANCRVEILDGNSFQLGTACIPKGGQGPVAVNGRNYFVTATTSCGLGFLGTQTHPSDWQLKLLGNC